ncbi:hypothetical protein AAHC03_016685 [Spirometra sp. Aus1]
MPNGDGERIRQQRGPKLSAGYWGPSNPPMQTVEEDTQCTIYAPVYTNPVVASSTSMRPPLARRSSSLVLLDPPRRLRGDEEQPLILSCDNYLPPTFTAVDAGMKDGAWCSIPYGRSRVISRILDAQTTNVLQPMMESMGPVPRRLSVSRDQSVSLACGGEGELEVDAVPSLASEDSHLNGKEEGDGEKGLNRAPQGVNAEAKQELRLEQRTSVLMAAWNVFNLIVGVGIMGLPYACAGAGWYSIPMIVLIGAICCYAGQLVGECLYSHRPKAGQIWASPTGGADFIRKRNTYACIAADAFPQAGRLITGVVVGLELFGASILYIILLGTSVHAIAIYVQPDQNLVSIPVGITVFSYLCLPLLLWPNMRVVAWSSFIAVIGLMTSIVAVLVGSGLQTTEVPVHWDALVQPNTEIIPISVGIILFSFCAHTILPGIEGNMRQPEYFPRMLNVTFTCATVIKVLFGVLCVLAFGRGVEQSVTDNIVNFPAVAILAHVCVMINVFFSLPLVFLILGEHIDLFFMQRVDVRCFNPTRSCGAYRIWILASRGALLSLGIFLAVQVPHFAIIMGLVGSLTGSLLCFIFPCLFSLKLFWKEISWCGRAVRIMILIFGVVGGVVGIIYSASECVSVFSE